MPFPESPVPPLPAPSPSLPAPSRSLLVRSFLLGAAVVATCLGVPSDRAAAVPAAVAPAAAVPAAVAPARARAAVPGVGSLGLTGLAVDVTVRRVRRSGQAQWIGHVLEQQLVQVDGCQARRTGTGWHGGVYRSTVRSVCPAGPAAEEAAVQALVRSRPWYGVRVTRVPLVGFSLVADLPTGNDRAVPAAVAQLPGGAAAFYEGDDVSLSYAGPGVTQARLDAAVSAFAAALGIPTSRVTVTPLATP